MGKYLILKSRLNNLFVYTFRTYPDIEGLRTNFVHVSVLGSLKKDLAELKTLISDEKPDIILGIAATPGISRVEPLAVNRFNASKLIRQNGPDKLTLYTPEPLVNRFSLSTRPSWTFCNWAMYCLQDFLTLERIPTKQIFMHLNPKDVIALRECLESCVSSAAH